MAYLSKHLGQIIDKNIDIINEFLNKTYPVGSIYMNINNINPGTLFGGTWELILDRMIMAAGSSYAAGSTGGNSSHTHTTGDHILTIDEIPQHTHNTYGLIPRINEELGGRKYGHSTSESSWWFQTVANEVKSTGGGASHNHGNTSSSSNLPPYLTVYIWKRIA